MALPDLPQSSHLGVPAQERLRLFLQLPSRWHWPSFAILAFGTAASGVVTGHCGPGLSSRQSASPLLLSTGHLSQLPTHPLAVNSLAKSTFVSSAAWATAAPTGRPLPLAKNSSYYNQYHSVMSLTWQQSGSPNCLVSSSYYFRSSDQTSACASTPSFPIYQTRIACNTSTKSACNENCNAGLPIRVCNAPIGIETCWQA